MELLLNLNSKINAIIWGPVMVAAIIGIGLYINFGIGFIQFTHLGRVLKEAFGKKGRPKEGDITPFQALNVALGGTVGVGNIAGVATAISFGGPGAIFWMWVSGLLGMATKFAEVVLAINYRIRQIRGPMIGGPMVYIRRGMGKKFSALAGAFALLGALAAFGIGNMTQANSVSEGARHFGIPNSVTAFVLMVAVGLVTIGGIKRIAHVAMFCVPFMCIMYFLTGITIIFFNYNKIPDAFLLIFKSAFTKTAACGGFLGAGVLQAMRWGIARGVFSNEAGLGSAPMAHSTAKTDHPVRQGFWGIFEVFIDTIVICSVTAIAILVSGVWSNGRTGASLTMSAFETVFGMQFGYGIVVLSMVLTAYDTNLAWCFYGETCSAYLFGPQARLPYRIVWLPFVMLGALGKLEVIWSIADTLNGLMAIPNLIALVALSGIVFKLKREFFKKNL